MEQVAREGDLGRADVGDQRLVRPVDHVGARGPRVPAREQHSLVVVDELGVPVVDVLVAEGPVVGRPI